MNKEALYYAEQDVYTFSATVLSCQKEKKYYVITLSEDGFYPEGGGQPSDQGVLSTENQKWKVLNVHEGSPNRHFIDHEIEVGTEVLCEVDQTRRFRLSQNHSGEHIVSGLIHYYFHYDNIGFHMESQGEVKGLMTIDFDGVLTSKDCEKIEREANEEVWKNEDIEILWNPDASLFYRSKKELDGDIRIVKIGQVDLCACCGTHVKSTGQIGLIKILSCQAHRKGSRLTMLCGMDAYQDASLKEEVLRTMTQNLSVSPYKGQLALSRLQNEMLDKNHQISFLQEEIFELLSKQIPFCPYYMHWFKDKDASVLRKACDYFMHHSLASTIFVGSIQSNQIRFALGSRKEDARLLLKKLSNLCAIHGGGQKEMVQGVIQASVDEVKKILKEENFYGM